MITYQGYAQPVIIEIPHGLSDEDRETLIYGVTIFALLLTRYTKSSYAHLAQLIAVHYAPHPRHTEVCRVLTLANQLHTTQE